MPWFWQRSPADTPRPPMTRGQKIAAATAIATSIAIPAEGIRQWAYNDPVGVLTVCYGQTGNVDPTRQYSMDECKALLNDSMRQAVEMTDACAPGLPTKTLAALSDLTYNVGPRAVCDPEASTLARMLRMGEIAAACEELPRWNKARVAGVLVSLPGLTKRRELEKAICLEGLA